jgi:two-component system LytT family response regulator
MSKINVIIIDDERPARKELTFLLKDFPEIVIQGEADSITKAIELIATQKPDLVFLDIQLSGENGFDLLKKIPIDFKVIFVTAYDEFAIKAFDVNASDYLLKPVDPKRLELALNRIIDVPTNTPCAENKFEYDDSMYVKQNNCTARFIEIKSIIAITSVGNHSKLETLDGNSYVILKTLKCWEAELPETFFSRIHRSTIVNIKHIININNYSKSHHQVYMKGIEDPFEVSRNCFKNLKQAHK